MAEIYKITNKVNGYFYIGKTTHTAEERFYSHLKDVEYGSKTKFHNALRKYGRENFVVEVLEKNVVRPNNRERYWIEKLKPEYNIAKGGDGGWIHDQTGNKWKVKDSSKMGRVFRERRHAEFVDTRKWSSGNNYQSTHFIMTPWGTFETWRDASIAASEERKKGNMFVVTDVGALQEYCYGKMLSPSGRRTVPEWRGKHTSKLGFGLVAKDKER